MALELRDEGIRAWQFARRDVPRDLNAAVDPDGFNPVPDPSSWGPAMADFPGTDCDVGAHFRNQSIIINITLCGTLTEALWGQSGCKSEPAFFFSLLVPTLPNPYFHSSNFSSPHPLLVSRLLGCRPLT